MSLEGPSMSQPALSGNLNQPQSKKNPWVRTVVYLLLIAIAALIVWRVWQSKKQAEATATGQAAALVNRPVPVQVLPAQQRTMPIFLTALGTVTPYMSVTVKARVTGELLPVKFVEGQLVHAGETIMQIDPKPYQAALDQAKGTLTHDQALLKNAQAQYARYKALFDAGVVSKETLDADEAAEGQYLGAIESDKAAVETAQLQLSWCTIQSPITGRIGLRLVDPGNIIAAGTTNLVVINQFEPIAVYFTLPENQLPQVFAKLAASHQLQAEAWDRGDTQKLATGVLVTADNQIDTTTGTGRLKAVFPNQDQVLFPNQFVNIHLVLENREDAVVVPSAAIQTGTIGSFVWVVETDKQKNTSTVRMQPVKVALAEGQTTIVDSGLSGGEPIVVDGTDRLRPAALVTVSAAQPRAGAQSPAASGAPAQGAAQPASPGAQVGHGKGASNGQHGGKGNRP